jgi:hypothetical protein
MYFGGIPFDGWKCGKITYTFSLQNFANGLQKMNIPVTERGCVPTQNGNPYNSWNCWNIETDNTNPYIMTLLQKLYWDELDVGAITGSLAGEYCMCGRNECNEAASTLRRSQPLVLLVLSLIIAVLRRVF